MELFVDSHEDSIIASNIVCGIPRHFLNHNFMTSFTLTLVSVDANVSVAAVFVGRAGLAGTHLVVSLLAILA